MENTKTVAEVAAENVIGSRLSLVGDLAEALPYRLDAYSSAESKGFFSVNFDDGGFQLQTEGIAIRRNVEKEPEQIEIMLCIGLWFIQQAEQQIDMMQAEATGNAVEQLQNEGALPKDMKPAELSPAIQTMAESIATVPQ